MRKVGEEIVAVTVSPVYAIPLTYAVRHSVIVEGLVLQSDIYGFEYVST